MPRLVFASTLVLLAAVACKPPSSGKPPADPQNRTDSNYQARLQAAMAISSLTTRDEALASLATAAAAAGEGEVVLSALGTISSLTTKDDAAARAAAKLAAAGHEEDAFEVAGQISSLTKRDEALKAIAAD